MRRGQSRSGQSRARLGGGNSPRVGLNLEGVLQQARGPLALLARRETRGKDGRDGQHGERAPRKVGWGWGTAGVARSLAHLLGLLRKPNLRHCDLVQLFYDSLNVLLRHLGRGQPSLREQSPRRVEHVGQGRCGHRHAWPSLPARAATVMVDVRRFRSPIARERSDTNRGRLVEPRPHNLASC